MSFVELGATTEGRHNSPFMICLVPITPREITMRVSVLLTVMALALAVVSPAHSESSMVPKKPGSGCPSGASDAGGGYCRSSSGYKYVEKRHGSGCPSGSSDAGGGYCRLR